MKMDRKKIADKKNCESQYEQPCLNQNFPFL